jgi:hypothetical protein
MHKKMSIEDNATFSDVKIKFSQDRKVDPASPHMNNSLYRYRYVADRCED